MEKTVEISRFMTPDDANFAGNVHGGTILKMIEEAGSIISARHCNSRKKDPSQKIWAALVRVEHTDFIQPIYIGEVATVDAEITYVSEHSLEVRTTVWAEDVIKCTKRKANRAFLWYVPVDAAAMKPVKVPPLEYTSPEATKAGRLRYEAQREDRKKTEELHKEEMSANGGPGKLLVRSEDAPAGTVRSSISSLIYIVHPSDCDKFGFAFGGFTMKMMDTVAGIVAFRHCRSNIVTACIDAVNFLVPIRVGYIVTFTGRMIFTSSRSIEIETFVDAENVLEGRHFRACSARFTFVSLDQNHKAIPVPPMVIENEVEQRRFDEGKKRYERKKLQRSTSEESMS